MKAILMKLFIASIAMVLFFGPVVSVAQEAEAEKDTVEAAQDNSSSFNDSVQFDDMEPIFYEAAEEDEAVSDDGGFGGTALYGGIAIVLVIVLVVLRKAGKKKS